MTFPSMVHTLRAGGTAREVFPEGVQETLTGNYVPKGGGSCENS